MKSKSEAPELVINFIKKIEKQSGRIIKRVHADNGTEFTRAFDYVDSQGVETTTSTAYTPESNGLAERMNGILTSMIRSCILQSKLPQSYWNFALRHVIDCKNAVPHSKTKKAPYEVLFGKRNGNVRHFRTFGCKVSFKPTSRRSKTFAPIMEDGLNLYHEI